MPEQFETSRLIVANPTQIVRLLRRRLCVAKQLFGLTGEDLRFANDLMAALEDATRSTRIWANMNILHTELTPRDDKVLPK